MWHSLPVLCGSGKGCATLLYGRNTRPLDAWKSNGMADGMQTMTHRTTFALDKTTAQRLKRLAARWHVSQAEVVRRSVEQAEKQAEPEKPDPVAMLRELFASGGGLDAKIADSYIAEVYEDRKHWRGE